MTNRSKIWLQCMGLAVAGLVFATAPANAQVSPPDLTVCDGVNCDNVQNSICSDGGFKITLTGFTAPNTSTSGVATYTYQICSPALGVCNGLVRAGETCSDNGFCKKKGQNEDPAATCSREREGAGQRQGSEARDRQEGGQQRLPVAPPRSVRLKNYRA